MCVRIVAPAEYARVGEVVREEVAQPVDAAARRPCLESSHRVAIDPGRQECGIERRMRSSIVREGCCEAELQGGCSMLTVEAIEGCCCRWLFVVQPAQPTQLANPAERRLVGCRRPTVEACPKHHAVAVRLPYSHACSAHCEN